jgi:hypothetical protein
LINPAMMGRNVLALPLSSERITSAAEGDPNAYLIILKSSKRAYNT